MKSTLSRKPLLSLFITILFFPFSLLAQLADGSITFAWGDKYELPKKHVDLGFIGNEQDGYLEVGHAPNRSLSFQRFDNKLHLTNEQIIDLKAMPDDYQNVSFTQVGSKYYWFFCTWVRSEEKERLFAQEIDVKNGKLTGTAKEICKSSKLTGTGVTNGWYSFSTVDKWNLFYSVDSNKLLVQYRKKPEVRDDSRSKDVIGFQVFDENMEKLWAKEIRMPYTEERMDNEDYHVDKDGNVYTLAKVYSEEKDSRKKPNYRMEILKWSKEGKDVVKIPFKFTDKFVNSAKMAKDFEGNLIVVGFYSNKKGNLSADGAFLLRLDENSGELTNVKKGTYEFPASVLAQFESARTKRKLERKDDHDDLEATNLELRNIIVNSDGSIQIYGEEYFVQVYVTSTGRGMTTTTYKYNYNDILALNIAPDGNLKWVVKVPKQQRGTNTGRSGMSFKLFSFRSNQYLFFMDNMKNIDLAPDERPAQHQDGAGGVLMVVKLDENGKYSKSKIFDVREEDKTLVVSNFNDVGEDRMMVRAYHRKQSQPAYIQFH